MLSFVSGWRKSEILRNKSKSKELQLTEDYSKEIMEKRKALIPQLIEERKKGKVAYIKYDKLIIQEHEKTSTRDSKKKKTVDFPNNTKHTDKKATIHYPIK